MTSRPLLLVTGGSRGIGAAVCRKAAAQGYDLLVNYRSDKAAAEAVAADCRMLSAEAAIVQGDTATEEGITAIFAAVDRLGPLHGLVNNAGVVDVTARVEEFDRARLDRMFAVNVIGKIRCATEAVRRMSTKHGGQGGVIVNISSMAAVIGSPGQYVDYAAAKAAVDTACPAKSRPRVSGSMPSGPGSSIPKSTHPVDCRTGRAIWLPSFRCKGPERRTKWPTAFFISSRLRHPM